MHLLVAAFPTRTVRSKKMVRIVEREISMSEMSLNTDKGNVEGDKQNSMRYS